MGRPFGAADIVVQRQIENQDKLAVCLCNWGSRWQDCLQQLQLRELADESRLLVFQTPVDAWRLRRVIQLLWRVVRGGEE
jgi:hypothetical protein